MAEIVCGSRPSTEINAEIRQAIASREQDIVMTQPGASGWGTLRERRGATFDDLTFLPCSLTRIPLEGYREKWSTKTVLGTRFARKPIELDIPVMITGMSWGALSYDAKVAPARGARTAGSSNTTGDGGMLMPERENSRTLIYEVLPLDDYLRHEQAERSALHVGNHYWSHVTFLLA